MRVLFFLLITTKVFASAPSIKCGAMGYYINPNGTMNIDKDVSHGKIELSPESSETDSITKTVGESEVSVSLKQICPAGPGPCGDNYRLSTSLKIQDSSSRTSSTITPNTERFFRQHLSLRSDGYSISINCDLN